MAPSRSGIFSIDSLRKNNLSNVKLSFTMPCTIFYNLERKANENLIISNKTTQTKEDEPAKFNFKFSQHDG